MILFEAAKLATAQRRVVRKVAQYVKGEFNIDDKMKMLNIKLDKDTYTSCIPKKLKDYAKDVIDKTGQYSKNPIKKIVSWVKSYIENFKELFKTSKNAKNEAAAVSDAAPAAKPETIKFDKDDVSAVDSAL